MQAASVIGAEMAATPHFTPLLCVQQQLQRLIWRVQQSPDHHPLHRQLRPILLTRDSMPQTSTPSSVTGTKETCEGMGLLCSKTCGSTAAVRRLAVSACLRRWGPHGDTAEEGVRHTQQVRPALHHAGHAVRQRCPLRHCCAAPAPAMMLRKYRSSTRGRQRYG